MRGREHHLVLLVLAWVAAKVAVHLLVPEGWDLHRDEYLYLALGRHLDWGYWSTAPVIGAISWFVQTISDAGPVAVRLPSILASATTIAVAAWMTHRMGGRTAAISLTGLALLVSPAMLRSGSMFQPVVFDILFWTLGAACVVGYVTSGKRGWIVVLGPVTGLGLLTKYSMAAFVVSLAVAALLTRHRRMLFSRWTATAAVLATLIVVPNMLWQARFGFPVLDHLSELATTQLVNVRVSGFLLDQLLMFFPGLIVWLGGLIWLFRTDGKPFRILGWLWIACVALMLAMSGKSYYTLGVYPALIAAGAVWLERFRSRWPARVVAVLVLAVGVILAPYSLPILKPATMEQYADELSSRTGIDAPRRWEDGQYYSLPQDYADMRGWRSLAEWVDLARDAAPDSGSVVVFAENYGQAGAIEYYARRAGPVTSFSDSYRIWAPDRLPDDLSAFIYVGSDSPTDLDSLFGAVVPMGSVYEQTARENGTTVFLFLDPLPGFAGHYARRVASVKEGLPRTRGD